jgi:hypothetical protein
MNERIKELAEQAKKYVDDKWAKEGSPLYPEAHYLFIQQRDEKFAELIVRECILQIADVRIEHDFDPQVDEVLVQALTGIKKHFGVEE